MSTPYLGQLAIFSFNFPPKGWALCNGQLLSINQNQALFALLGTYYGGNGVTTFALPNLQGLVPMMFSNSNSAFYLAVSGGEASHTLVAAEMPAHSHALNASTAAGTTTSPIGSYPAAAPSNPYIGSTGSNVIMGTTSSALGSGQPHENRSPFLVVNYCIALTGIFPSRN